MHDGIKQKAKIAEDLKLKQKKKIICHEVYLKNVLVSPESLALDISN